MNTIQFYYNKLDNPLSRFGLSEMEMMFDLIKCVLRTHRLLVTASVTATIEKLLLRSSLIVIIQLSIENTESIVDMQYTIQ